MLSGKEGKLSEQGETSIPRKFQLELVWPSDTCLSLWPGRGQRTEFESESYGGRKVGLEPIHRVGRGQIRDMRG